MKPILWFLLVSLLLSTVAFCAPFEYRNIPVTRWVDSQGRLPIRYSEYLQAHPLRPLSAQRLGQFHSQTDTEIPVAVVVEQSLYPNISTALTTFVNDLIADDFDVLLIEWGGGTPEILKDSLIAWWQDSLAQGAVLIGDLPVAWYELYEDFNDDGIPDNPTMVDFPCDLFYMDMDGTWEDQDHDGMYDLHEGNTAAEFWVGELRASELSGSESDLVNNYLAKNHAYRQGTLVLPSLGLNYIDDDWSGGASVWGEALRTAFGSVQTISEINATNADDYLLRLDTAYAFIQVAVHSSPFVHAFKENNGNSWGYIQNWEIRNTDPMAYFVNLFACSNCRFVETDYMGGWYLFGNTYGLGAIGSTKTGAMLYFEDYYPVLGDMGTFGEALAHWISLHGDMSGHVMWSRSWFYGMCHLGDPTLRIPRSLLYAGMQIDDDSTGLSLGDDDGIFDAGETIELSLDVENRLTYPCEGVTVVLSCEDTCITVISNPVQSVNIPPEGTVTFQGFVLCSHLQTPNNHQSLINMVMSDNAGHIWYDSFTLQVFAPVPICAEYQITEVQGNGNYWADPGETIDCYLLVSNSGGETIRNLSAETELITGNATLINTQVAFNIIPPNLQSYSLTPFRMEINSNQPMTEAIHLLITFSVGGRELNQAIIAIPMSVGYHATFAFEADDPALRHYSVSDTYHDTWHQSTQTPHNGTGCEKFGDIGVGNYPPMADGALEFPMFPIGMSGTLTLWHKIDAEVGYDGGIVEVNTGQGWSLLIPVGGYPCTSGNNGSFPANSPCYSGQIDWTPITFNLPVAGFTKIRFRFGSDGGVEGLGWFLDDLTITSPMTSVTETPLKQTVPLNFSLMPAFPNPFNGETKIEFTIPSGANSTTELTVFNLLGQRVATLWSGKEAGNYSITWSGSDSKGIPLSSGLYFIQLQSQDFSQINKVIILR